MAKNLANRINQEHYIEHELKKVFETAYKLGFEEATKQAQSLQLQQTGVSGSNWFQNLPLHWRYIYYMIGGIIIGYLIHYCH